MESYSLFELDAYPEFDGNREMEATVYGEIVQMKQDKINPIFRCQVNRDHHVMVQQRPVGS
jgi:hypothetical protein